MGRFLDLILMAGKVWGREIMANRIALIGSGLTGCGWAVVF